MNATTSTVMNRVAVSKSWKLRSICVPIGHPMITQNGICTVQDVKWTISWLSPQEILSWAPTPIHQSKATMWKVISITAYHKHGDLSGWSNGNSQGNILLIQQQEFNFNKTYMHLLKVNCTQLHNLCRSHCKLPHYHTVTFSMTPANNSAIEELKAE